MLIPVILCGGEGSRLWPLSRRDKPKPFLKMADGQSLLQKTLIRALALPDVQHIVIVANQQHAFAIEDELKAYLPPTLHITYILEPIMRNTAPAIASTALYCAETFGADSQLLIMPSDHLISDVASFKQAVNKAEEDVLNEYIVTFGIKPDYAETGYGYIHAEGRMVISFHEKPDAPIAEEFLQSGAYWWNAGIFYCTARVMLSALQQYAPDIYTAIREAYVQSRILQNTNIAQIRLPLQCYEVVPACSIDVAVMEKTHNLAMIVCEIGWSDVGSLLAIEQCQIGTVSAATKVIQHNADNCFVYSDHRAVSLVGVHDLVVVQTEDVLLIANKDAVQDVKHVYQQLKMEEHETC